jgi:hypothetical protein
MRLSRLLLVSLLLLATAAGAADTSHRIPARPDSTTFSTDLTGLWYNPLENGWGVNVIQQGGVLFVTMFVYDSNNKPTWYFGSDVAFDNVDSNGGYNFVGTLYQASGTYFGASYNGSQFGFTQVGTITLRFASYTTGTMTYTVNGTTVVKNIIPQTWVNNDVSGSYVGAMAPLIGNSNCLLPLQQPTGLLRFHFSQSALNATITVTDASNAQCTLTGTVKQYGKLSDIDGSYTCSGGATGTFGLRRLEAGVDGLSGAYFAFGPSCSTSVATIGAAYSGP